MSMSTTKFHRRIHPRNKHWQTLEQLDKTMLMTPQEFLTHWDVRRVDLAAICDCSATTVFRWFSEGESYKEPTLLQKKRLGFVHKLWSRT